MKPTRLFTLVLLSLIVCCAAAKERKVVYIVVDGIPADYIDRLQPATIYDISSQGHYARAYTGGDAGTYSETPTVSAIGYTNILTGTWMNKHNVNGNSNLNPNYNYWTLFRMAKEQKTNYTTGLFSSWLDNRTVLIGEGKPETGNLKIDYVADGFENDTINFPRKKDELHIFDIDSVVCQKAAECIRTYAPHLSWVYLWYTDSGFHLYGDSKFMDYYVQRTDAQLKHIWEAVKYREAYCNEEWMVIVTTDHGRTDDGHGHGGQSQRERTVWISTNVKEVNQHFFSPTLSLVDIHPTICSWMGFEVPKERAWELDGLPFIGKADISDLTIEVADGKATLSWKSDSSYSLANIYIAASNNFAKGGNDTWEKVGTTLTKKKKYTIDLSKYPESAVYKFVIATKNNHLTRWYVP
ncbi:MAG: alkaline phosphatase family protein [Muribaculaceae bacterium]